MFPKRKPNLQKKLSDMASKDFTDIKFVRSAPNSSQFLYDHPIVTFIGRSNVGKSTLINQLVQRKNFMKTSKTAGQTNMVNYSLIDNKFYLVDVPGYGFATFARDNFAGLMKDFLEDNKALKKVYILVDGRRLLLPADDDFASYLESLKIPYAFVFTKTDKMTSSEKHYLNLQKEKLAPAPCFEVGLKMNKKYQDLRDDILNTVKGA